MDKIDFNTIIPILVLVFPGFVSWKIYTLVIPSAPRSSRDSIFDLIAYSLVNWVVTLPLIVLTAGKFKPNRELSPEKSKEWNRIWVQELQPQLAHLSTRGRQVIVDSGHLIPFEAPEAVVKAVDEVLAMAKEIAERAAF